MSGVPVGIDLGNFSTVIGVARNRGIDVIVNEVSNRSTPSLVAFGSKNRFLGEAAKSQEISNLKNTAGSLVRILGRTSNDPNLDEEKKFVTAPFVDIDGAAGVKVRYLNKQQDFTSVQLAASFLTKIKSIATNEIKATVFDVVLAVPVWYSDAQRRAAADAAIIAGLNPVRIVNDITAAAVGYGVFRTDLPEDKPINVAFVDVGDSTYSVSIARFKKGELKVLGTSYDKNFGGRYLNLAIANHFANIIQDKYKVDINTNPKAFARVLGSAEKLKKVLSANTSAPFNVENVMDDVDVSSSMTREELEGYIQPLLERIPIPIEKALKDAGLTVADIDQVELIGGSSRVPSIKEKIKAAFGDLTLSFTLNQDEAIARGAAFICAIHSPTLRVRPFKFEDINPHSVTFSWDAVEGEDISELEVFPKGGPFPNTKVITLFRSEDFSLDARYTNAQDLEPGTEQWIGRWYIKGVKPTESGEPVAVKIKLRNDPSGLYVVESAYTAVEVEVEEPIVEEGKETKEGEEPAEVKTRKVKKLVKKDNLSIVHQHHGLDEAARSAFLEKEAQMTVEDKLVAETLDRKNTLEEYTYEIQSKIADDGLYANFASEQEKATLNEKSEKARDWLYGDDGEDASKAQYIAKYEELTSIGNLIKGRYQSKIEEERQARLAAQQATEAKKIAEKLAADKATREAKEAEDASKKANDSKTQDKDADGDIKIDVTD